MQQYKVEFPGTDYPSVVIEANEKLPDVLNDENSPIPFGCRNGICATCLVDIVEADGKLAEPLEEEQLTLEICAPDNPKARLACQLNITANIKIKKIDPI